MLFLSWNKTLRLWDLESGKSTVTFVEHVNDVLSCSLSADNKQNASGGMDKTIIIWNIVGQWKYTYSIRIFTNKISKKNFNEKKMMQIVKEEILNLYKNQ